MILPALALAFQSDTIDHTFTFATDANPKQVSVAGTFNNWNKGANLMKFDAATKVWKASLKIPVGKHLYKFVLNDENWVTDPKAKSEDDGGGNINSILFIFPKGYSRPGRPGDGVITTEVIRHDQSVNGVNLDQGKLRLRLVTRTGDIADVRLVSGTKSSPMTLASSDDLFAIYESAIDWDGKKPLTYSFQLRDGKTALTFGKSGVKAKDAFTLSPKTFKPLMVPNWVEKTVFYQIFPDRFDNGDKSNDPAETENWDTGVPTYSNWFGGDAAGISKRISYLKGLGLNGIYINPVMLGNSNHRYDPCDFFKIDPPFGTNEEFIKLSEDLQKAGIRTVLDQIFDHVGIKFPPFLDLLKNQKDSKYKDWFFVKSWPVEVRQNPPYEGWFGTEYMPKLNMNHPEVRKYLLDSVDFWMKKATLAGWRLDVANEVPMEFWRVFRQYVKQRDPNAWIVGEVWYNAAPWLGGDQWDASMNYPFRDNAVRFIAQGTQTATQFANGLMQVYNYTAPQIARNQLNLLSSHDTERFIHLAGGNRELQKLGAVLQFTWVGSPSVYYGEEIGMPGGKDPDNRRPMMWKDATPQNDILTLYKKLIALRTQNEVLAAGSPVILSADDSKKTVAYARVHGSDSVITVINRSDQPQTLTIPLGRMATNARLKAQKTLYKDALTGTQLPLAKSDRLVVTVKPMSAIIAVQNAGSEMKSAAILSNTFRSQNP